MEKLQDLSFQTYVLENTPVHRHNIQEPTSHQTMQANEPIFSKYLCKEVKTQQ